MSKHIVICMDGTWNDPSERTNVYQIFRMLPGAEQRIGRDDTVREHLRKDNAQVQGFYLEGVGAKGRRQGPLGGGLGVGLHSRVIDAYLLASKVYAPGDKLWIFGFSRGAWSARSLAGLIGGMGLVDRAPGLDAALEAERRWTEMKLGKSHETGPGYWNSRDPQPIRLVGVWDTVGALGIPFFNGLRAFDSIEARVFDFADLDLSPRVEFGRQALAIDETRFDFTPTRWNPRQGVVETWFPGVHSDVGGGYPNTGLSDGALRWMVDEINGLNGGLQLSTASLGNTFNPDPLQDRHDEARGLVWKLRPQKPRKIGAGARLDATVTQRLQGRSDYRPVALKDVPACQPYYAGVTLPVPERLQSTHERSPVHRLEKPGDAQECPVFALKWWNAAGLQVRRGEQYEISASGEWTDKATVTSPAGYPSDGWVLRLVENSRRVESAPWFTLIAAIHPDADLEAKNPTTHNMVTGGVESVFRGVSRTDGQAQLAAVGRRGKITVERDGFLYLFANDSPFAYGNNSGYLDAQIKRL